GFDARLIKSDNELPFRQRCESAACWSRPGACELDLSLAANDTNLSAASAIVGTDCCKRDESTLCAAKAVESAAAKTAGSLAGTNRSRPATQISGIPPTLLATNGVPHACDSSSTLGTPSDRLGSTVTSAARYQSAN